MALIKKIFSKNRQIHSIKEIYLEVVNSFYSLWEFIKFFEPNREGRIRSFKIPYKLRKLQNLDARIKKPFLHSFFSIIFSPFGTIWFSFLFVCMGLITGFHFYDTDYAALKNINQRVIEYCIYIQLAFIAFIIPTTLNFISQIVGRSTSINGKFVYSLYLQESLAIKLLLNFFYLLTISIILTLFYESIPSVLVFVPIFFLGLWLLVDILAVAYFTLFSLWISQPTGDIDLIYRSAIRGVQEYLDKDLSKLIYHSLLRKNNVNKFFHITNSKQENWEEIIKEIQRNKVVVRFKMRLMLLALKIWNRSCAEGNLFQLELLPKETFNTSFSQPLIPICRYSKDCKPSFVVKWLIRRSIETRKTHTKKIGNIEQSLQYLLESASYHASSQGHISSYRLYFKTAIDYHLLILQGLDIKDFPFKGDEYFIRENFVRRYGQYYLGLVKLSLQASEINSDYIKSFAKIFIGQYLYYFWRERNLTSLEIVSSNHRDMIKIHYQWLLPKLVKSNNTSFITTDKIYETHKNFLEEYKSFWKVHYLYSNAQELKNLKNILMPSLDQQWQQLLIEWKFLKTHLHQTGYALMMAIFAEDKEGVKVFQETLIHWWSSLYWAFFQNNFKEKLDHHLLSFNLINSDDPTEYKRISEKEIATPTLFLNIAKNLWQETILAITCAMSYHTMNGRAVTELSQKTLINLVNISRLTITPLYIFTKTPDSELLPSVNYFITYFRLLTDQQYRQGLLSDITSFISTLWAISLEEIHKNHERYVMLFRPTELHTLFSINYLYLLNQDDDIATISNQLKNLMPSLQKASKLYPVFNNEKDEDALKLIKEYLIDSEKNIEGLVKYVQIIDPEKPMDINTLKLKISIFIANLP